MQEIDFTGYRMECQQEILARITKTYLEGLPQDWRSLSLTIAEIAYRLLYLQTKELNFRNQNLPKGMPKMKLPVKLEPEDAVDLLLRVFHICRISTGDVKYDDEAMLAVYQEEGPWEGIYSCRDTDIQEAIHALGQRYSKREIEDLLFVLQRKAKTVLPCQDKNLVPVHNGIYHRDSDTLTSFSPDIVFTTKCPVDFVPDAESPRIPDGEGGYWEIEEWMRCLHPEQSVTELLWQGLAASIRPNGCWDKSLWLYSEKGNNGKGTYCELMRSLCGGRNWTSAPISVFSKEFGLEGLVGVNTIITDENSVESYGEKLESMKAVITGDVVVINRKFKSQIAQRFTGFMLQCVNSLPRTRDKSGSWYRRLIFVPMAACFTGRENKLIKSEYVKRQDVLEYVLQRVLRMQFDVLSEPEPCKQLLNQYKRYNDTVREWWEDTRSEYVWDLLPFDFLYDVYNAWCKINAPGTGSLKRKTVFTWELAEIIDEDDDWDYVPGKGNNKFEAVRTGNRMDAFEPMIIEYDLTRWMSDSYKGSRSEEKAKFLRKGKYRGLYRTCAVSVSAENGSE